MGILIAIDGLDASGKETQSRLLSEALAAQGKRVRVLSFPTYDEVGSSMLKFYLSGGYGADPAATGAYAASSFFAMDRYHSYQTDWHTFYEEPDTVLIANRYTTANAVHQLTR